MATTYTYTKDKGSKTLRSNDFHENNLPAVLFTLEQTTRLLSEDRNFVAMLRTIVHNPTVEHYYSNPQGEKLSYHPVVDEPFGVLTLVLNDGSPSYHQFPQSALRQTIQPKTNT